MAPVAVVVGGQEMEEMGEMEETLRIPEIPEERVRELTAPVVALAEPVARVEMEEEEVVVDTETVALAEMEEMVEAEEAAVPAKVTIVLPITVALAGPAEKERTPLETVALAGPEDPAVAPGILVYPLLLEHPEVLADLESRVFIG